ncbi:Rod shape-determining protein MreD [Thioalkalivibrio nitratireducens DSM 14787]|uniref:Rod shape-determining protein MreD n=1 Tax=Thioalkalivibrio nitratireducens (strain DSM 14787 / UNIQEM 213 / ALEN2) TaxID=1255043 RepID=L0DZD7_THIND|nr:rod shape-determining protein MreD [Thioalkalivibrio nitratireducens]AGA34330.1 Rod shape-determining protein MreD [Thioalkalivibrio nitratireducens DSM 14787]
MTTALGMPAPVAVSLLVALALTIVPLPDAIAATRPEWVLLVLIYWGMAFPRRVGIVTAFIAGLFLDVLQNQLLGQNALSLAVAMFIVLQIYPRMRVFPVWQQSVAVAFLVTLVSVLNLWVRGATGLPPGSMMYWAPVLSSALVWPLLYHVLREARRRWLLHLT